jgi:GT2 family glycosyltransferase
MKESPIASIIVLNYNGKAYLENCLDSIVKSHYKNYELILVDNASKDGSVEFVKKRFSTVKVIQTEKNLGFAEGNNIGARQATGAYLIFLNNDTQVTPCWLEKMIESAEADASMGVCGSKVLLLDRKNVIDVIGGFVCDIFGSGLNALGHLEIDNHQYDSQREIFSVVGACLLIKRRLFEDIGGFDSSYFLLGEDIDLCWRAQLAGYKVIVVPSAVIYHKSMGTIKSQQDRKDRGKLRFLSERNTLRSILKNYEQSTLFKILPYYFGLLFFETVFFLITGNTILALADFRSVVWNVKNFRTTWALHAAIKSIRAVSDIEIQEKMEPQSLKLLNFESLFKNLMGKIK